MSAPEVEDGPARLTARRRRHGGNATAFQLREPGFLLFWPDDDACVGYFDTGAPAANHAAPVTK